MRQELKNSILRRWTADDAEALPIHANNPNIAQNMRDGFPYPYTKEHAIKWLSMAMENPWFHAIEINGQACGGIAIHPFDDVYRYTAEMGYWLSEMHWGKGIMTEAVIAFTEFVNANTELVRLEAGVYGWNPGSMRVLEKAGYYKESILTKSVFKNGLFTDKHLYVKIR